VVLEVEVVVVEVVEVVKLDVEFLELVVDVVEVADVTVNCAVAEMRPWTALCVVARTMCWPGIASDGTENLHEMAPETEVGQGPMFCPPSLMLEV
jgi:hypothetical protein